MEQLLGDLSTPTRFSLNPKPATLKPKQLPFDPLSRSIIVAVLFCHGSLLLAVVATAALYLTTDAACTFCS